MQKHGKTTNLHKNQVNDMYQKKELPFFKK